jgi:hypothetical protein
MYGKFWFFSLLIFTVILSSAGALNLFSDDEDREANVIKALSETASAVGWSDNVFEASDWNGMGFRGKCYQINPAGSKMDDVDTALIAFSDESQPKQVLDIFQENGMRRTTFHGYDAIIMKNGEKICEAGGTVGFVLDLVKKVAVWFGEQLGTPVDTSIICAEATGTVAWTCSDVLFITNSPGDVDISEQVAEILYEKSEKLKLCGEGENLTGNIYDDAKNPLPNVKVTLKWDDKEYSTFAKDDGSYKILGPKTFIPDPDSEKIGEITVELVDKDGKIEVRDGSDANKIVYILKKFELKGEGDMKQDVKFPINDFTDMATSTNRAHLNDAAVIYWETLKAIKFYPKYLKENVDYQMPETISVYKAGCSACHSGLPGGVDEGISYDPGGSNYNNKDKPDNREWHEFAHHMMVDAYGAFPVTVGVNHGMFANADTADSWLEGFAVALPLIMANEFGQANPQIYDWNSGADNLEVNWLDTQDEEFCVAGLIWDLYDGKDKNDHDQVQLSKEQIWKVIGTKTDNIKNLYDKLNAANITDLSEDENKDGISDLDDIFIAHGIYQDKNNNTKYDKNETVGKGDINRPGRE